MDADKSATDGDQEPILGALSLTGSSPLLVGLIVGLGLLSVLLPERVPGATLVPWLLTYAVGAIAYVSLEQRRTGNHSDSLAGIGNAFKRIVPRLPAFLIVILLVLTLGMLVFLPVVFLLMYETVATVGAVFVLTAIVAWAYIFAKVVLAFPATILDGHGPFESIGTAVEASTGNVPGLIGISILFWIGSMLLTDGAAAVEVGSPGSLLAMAALAVSGSLLILIAHFALGAMYINTRNLNA